MARGIFRQLIAAVYYLHSQGIVHRDIKLENVLLDESNNVRLIDFGLAARWQPGQLLHTMCGYADCLLRGRVYRRAREGEIGRGL